jgi:membrane protease YdiL (CAAX protease family)
MAEHPWNPRVFPFLSYLVLLALIGFASDKAPAAYPLLYLAQVTIITGLLWRYRRLTPELTLTFHWLAIPVGVIVFIAWVWLGMISAEFTQARQAGLSAFTENLTRWALDPAHPPAMATATGQPFSFVDPNERAGSVFIRMGLSEGQPLAWFAFVLRLLGMSLVVPLFEELFIRSLMLRSLNSRRDTLTGIIQLAQDLPVIGDRLMGTRRAEEADKQPPMFEHQFNHTPLGHLTLFGVLASTLVFTLSHAPRDYAGCVFCGVAYCLCLRFTRHKGLGPVCWAHAITNTLIWVYTLHTDDWRFL